MSMDSPKIAMITAGAAGMYCGSCLQDNSLALALRRLGADVRLIPTYTPITTDEADASIDRVFYGGINVYLQQKSRLFRRLPPVLFKWLDHPALIRWASSRGIETNAPDLGELCLSMLRGEHGYQRREVDKLVRWLRDDERPDLVHFSNVLIAACSEAIRRDCRVPVWVSLQGDDIFLEGLPDQYRQRAINEIQRIDQHVDGYVAHSRFYADRMSSYLGISRDKIQIVPLGIEAERFREVAERRVQPPGEQRPLKLGYLARLAPEKGLDLLCAAISRLAAEAQAPGFQLLVAGWLGSEHRDYANRALAVARQAIGEGDVIHLGVIDGAQKLEFLAQIDLLCVPGPFPEPKGLYALEAMAAGVPVVEPDNGAFPELLSQTGGGKLFRSGDAEDLTRTLAGLMRQPQQLFELGKEASEGVRTHRSIEASARNMLAIYRTALGN